MPELIKQYKLSISPEQFTNACSDVEIMELQLILNSNRYDHILNKNKESGADEISKDTFLNDNNVKDLIKLFGDQTTEALEIMKELKIKTFLPFSQLMQLMPFFKKLEALRIRNLVARPQEVPELEQSENEIEN